MSDLGWRMFEDGARRIRVRCEGTDAGLLFEYWFFDENDEDELRWWFGGEYRFNYAGDLRARFIPILEDVCGLSFADAESDAADFVELEEWEW